MSKRTSEDFSNAIEIPDPNELESVDDEEEVHEGSKEPDSKESAVEGGNHVFYRSLKLVPSEIRTSDNNAVVAYLRSIQ
ncbi:hypothetical protein TrVE_jg13110 [Triparma verrucosa]|uniref:Uncharacterized protein n=1 Tax=Triparma verrucosa TaxID=1606542 RepID=A0A9W7CKQ8_9STRA|nr:hypothetical protein TrVE_jg13110 [Triparma verrucosa]